MRALLASCLLLSVLGACELEPGPKKAPPAAPTTPPVADPTAAAPTPPPANPPPANPPPANPPPANPPPVNPPPVNPPVADGAGSGSAALPPVSQPCLDVSGHIADALIAEASDPAKKGAMEQEKTKIIRRSAEACTRDAWKAPVMKCFLAAKTTAEMQTCAKDLAGP